jgi:hypothetical protein
MLVSCSRANLRLLPYNWLSVSILSLQGHQLAACHCGILWLLDSGDGDDYRRGHGQHCQAENSRVLHSGSAAGESSLSRGMFCPSQVAFFFSEPSFWKSRLAFISFLPSWCGRQVLGPSFKLSQIFRLFGLSSGGPSGGGGLISCLAPIDFYGNFVINVLYPFAIFVFVPIDYGLHRLLVFLVRKFWNKETTGVMEKIRAHLSLDGVYPYCLHCYIFVPFYSADSPMMTGLCDLHYCSMLLVIFLLALGFARPDMSV